MDQPLVHLDWRSKDLTEIHRTQDVGHWSGEGFRVNGNRTQSYPGAEHNVVSPVKVKVPGRPLNGVLGYFENVRQRTWDYIPNRDCMWDSFQQK